MSAGQDENLSPGPDAPVHGTDPLSPDETTEMNRLEAKAESGVLTQPERDHLDYLRRRDQQQAFAQDMAAQVKSAPHPLLDAIPKTPEELAKATPLDPVALNRAQSAAYQGLMASGAVTAQQVTDHKLGLQALGVNPAGDANGDVESHKAANRGSGLDENDGIETNDAGVEVISAAHSPTNYPPEAKDPAAVPGGVPAPQNAPGGGMPSGGFDGGPNDGTGPGGSDVSFAPNTGTGASTSTDRQGTHVPSEPTSGNG